MKWLAKNNRIDGQYSVSAVDSATGDEIITIACHTWAAALRLQTSLNIEATGLTLSDVCDGCKSQEAHDLPVPGGDVSACLECSGFPRSGFEPWE